MSFREHHSRWEFDLKSSPDSLWPFVADTNRFNRDTGVPKLEIQTKYTNVFRMRVAKCAFHIYGLPVEWEEQPFEWVKPHAFWRRTCLQQRPDGVTESDLRIESEARWRHAHDLRNPRHTTKRSWPGRYPFADQFCDWAEVARCN